MNPFQKVSTIMLGWVFVTFAMISSVHALDYYVDVSVGPGSHAGTIDDPFAAISDAMDVAVSGDSVHVATGTYIETFTVPHGVRILGGYTQDWQTRDPDAWPSIVDGNGQEDIIVGAGQIMLDGLTIQNGGNGVWASAADNSSVINCTIQNIVGMDGSTGSFGSSGRDAYGINLTGSHVTVSDCRIDNISGGAGGSAAEPGGESGWGGTAIGIRIHSANPVVTNCGIFQINGGRGGDGLHNNCHGGDGGSAFALSVSGNGFSYLPDISSNQISVVSAGNGGNGGVEWDYAGSSGDGGHAVGIRMEGFTKNPMIADNRINELSGGSGGSSPWAHLVAGYAGNGGDTTGIQMVTMSDSSVSGNQVLSLVAGNGGTGGSSGDFPGAGTSTPGGNGGAARGIHDSSSEGNRYFNNLIAHVTGGDGKTGGSMFQTLTCSTGGTGGLAAGIDIEAGGHFIEFNTVHHVSGGNGGNGGTSYWPEKGADSPKITATPTPTSTPATPSGSVCCGQGGDGGYGVGCRFPDYPYMERFTHNIVLEVTGGLPGQCFSPIIGEGIGMEKSGGDSSEIDLNDVFDCSTDLYSNLSPGAASLNADPLFASGSLGDHYLSNMDAGQEFDSPCIDAGNRQADMVFNPDDTTNRTDHEPDIDWVDFGFHYHIASDPTPTMTPTSTPTATPTAPPYEYTVSGRLYEFEGCVGYQRGWTVILDPLGVSTTTDLNTGFFEFTGIHYGDYTITASPGCNPFGCWPVTEVHVEDSDVYVDICPDASTPTPTATPTVTPTPTATPEFDLTVTLQMPAAMFSPGDTFYCRLLLHNYTQDAFEDHPVFAILDVAGLYLFAPSFTEFDHYDDPILPAETMITIIPDFLWPEGCGQMNDVRFYAAVTDPNITRLVSNLDSQTFGWSD